jgi:adenine-specific DNA methylase
MTIQLELPLEKITSPSTFSTFTENMKLPVHRWFRYSAGFSARWVEAVINKAKLEVENITVFDPFAGAGTTLIAAEKMGVESYGVEAHPFVTRIAQAKLLYRTDAAAYLKHIKNIIKTAETSQSCVDN